MKDTRIPAVRRILWTDYPAFFAASILAAAWIVFLAWAPNWNGRGPVFAPGMIPLALTLCLVISAVTLSYLVWRVRLLRRVFLSGRKVSGRIAAYSLRGARGQAEITYFFENEPYRVSASLHRNQQTRSLHIGDHVTLVVDRGNPQRAFIYDIYI